MKFNPVTDIPDLTGKVIFITGGTAGIGKETVLALAKHHPAHIYFTGRNAEVGSTVVAQTKEVAPNCEVTFIRCDLSSSRQAIRSAIVGGFTSSKLDIFIQNAGIMRVPPALTEEGFEVQFGTNYFGHAIMLRLLLPVMLRTAEIPGSDVRLVVLSSVGHRDTPPAGIEFDKLRETSIGTSMGRYGVSKLADILLARAVANRYPHITSVSLHPGIIDTELMGRTESSFLTNTMSHLKWTPMFTPADRGAHNTLWCATTAKENLKNGAYYEPVGKLAGRKKMLSGASDLCFDDDLSDKLWEWTERELAGLKGL